MVALMSGTIGQGRLGRQDVHRQLEAGLGELRERAGGLPDRVSGARVWDEIWCQETHASVAIEGNRLTLREVALLLHDGRAAGDKRLTEYLEVRGYADAADWVYRHGLTPGEWTTGGLLNITEVRHLHRLVMNKVWDVAPHADASPREDPGSFRRHDVDRLQGGVQPPAWQDVPELVGEWVATACMLRAPGRPLLEALAELHAGFERIHPFIDGNGRTGRLLLNLLLVRLGYPPAIIQKSDRVRYVEWMRGADRGDPGPLAELLARSVIDTLMRLMIPVMPDSAPLVPLATLADEELSARALRTAAERGRLQAQRDGRGRWHSARPWVDEYRASRYQRDG